MTHTRALTSLSQNTGVTCSSAGLVWLDSRTDTITSIESAALPAGSSFTGIKADGGLALATVRDAAGVSHLYVCEQRMPNTLRAVPAPANMGFFDMDESKAVWMAPEGLSMWRSNSNDVSVIVPDAPGMFADPMDHTKNWRIAMGDNRIYVQQPSSRVIRMF